MAKRGVDGAGRRKMYMMMIVEMVRKTPGITISDIQTEMGWREGLTPRKVSEYVEILVQVGQIREEDQGFSVAERR